DCRLDKFVFVKFATGKRESPRGPGVIALNAAGGEHREMFTPRSVFVLDRDEPLSGTPYGSRIIFTAGLLICRHPAEQHLAGIKAGRSALHVHHSAAYCAGWQLDAGFPVRHSNSSVVRLATVEGP